MTRHGRSLLTRAYSGLTRRRNFVRTDASAMERETEKGQAFKAQQRAQAEAEQVYVLTQEDPKRLSIPKAKRISLLKHATENLLDAKEWLEQLQRRSNDIIQFVRATFDYDDAVRSAARHRVLLRWVLGQVPLIEAEVNAPKVDRPGSDGGRITKRKIATDEEPPERQSPKRLSLAVEGLRLASTSASPKVTETQPEPGMVMGQEASQGSQPEDLAVSRRHQNNTPTLSRGPRRSSRTAALRDVSKTALEPRISKSRSGPRLKATSAQPPRSLSPSQETKAHTARRKLRGTSQRPIAQPIRRSKRLRERD